MYPTMAASPPRDSPLDEVFPAPHFEGSEKRIELVFDLPSADSRGLRELSRQQIDELMTLAACEVVATRHSDAFDGYVLSESSLFVYADRFVLKTCGTTRLLNSVPACVALASDLGLALRRVRYSRASFLFPECQPALYRDWSQEVAFLNHHLVDFPGTPYSYVMGDALSGLQWHVYVSDADATAAKDGSRESTYSVEVCMTELGRDQVTDRLASTCRRGGDQVTIAGGSCFLALSCGWRLFRTACH